MLLLSQTKIEYEINATQKGKFEKEAFLNGMGNQ